MEKFILGIFSIFISLILFVIAHLSTVSYYTKLNSWTNPPGKYVTSLNETGNIVPIRLSIVFLISGITLIIIYFAYDKFIKNKKNLHSDK